MKKLFCFSIVFSSFIFLIGCAPKRMYYYGDYSKSLYHYEKNHNDESLNKHKQELETIISESESKNLPVPPGIYAELGFLNMRSNNTKEAIRLFQAESSIYPESKLLMDRLINRVQTKENSISTSSVNQSSFSGNNDSKEVIGDEIEKQ
ncbi:lipoprotein [Desulfosarcina ovata subsp. sediminis]|uniref:Lipoprotein n=1 Tax=Desulfosarcina ovata subsp. sediminis TaxID=885957 RepID=A0A5K7ZQM5_9BACT|nr:DUF4810 domain-containing protein [Desulfosarcina ovata]BBO79723.1 lipoprotein [Desulfosarcina ovata subsp. sediminis]